MFERMKTRSFAVLVICIIATGVFVCMVGDPKPTFHDIVTKTHQHLSRLNQLKVPIVVQEPKEPGEDEQYLLKLGFDENPRLYPKDIWHNVTLPIVTTAIDSGQSLMAVGFMKSIQSYLPEHHLIIYDLGLDATELLLVSKYCNATNCTLRRFDFESFPSHISNTKLQGYRPIIIQRVLNEAGAALWLDVQYQVHSSKIQSLLEKARNEGLVSWTINEPTSTLTHPRMYVYFDTQRENYYFHRMVEPSHIILYNVERVHRELMLPWLQCVLTSECLAPIGAQSGGCRFDKKPHYRYSGCHRYDMSALNVALGKMFNFKARAYVANNEDKFFHKPIYDLEGDLKNNNATTLSMTQSITNLD